MDEFVSKRRFYEEISNNNPNCYVNENRYVRLKIIYL